MINNAYVCPLSIYQSSYPSATIYGFLVCPTLHADMLAQPWLDFVLQAGQIPACVEGVVSTCESATSSRGSGGRQHLAVQFRSPDAARVVSRLYAPTVAAPSSGAGPENCVASAQQQSTPRDRAPQPPAHHHYHYQHAHDAAGAAAPGTWPPTQAGLALLSPRAFPEAFRDQFPGYVASHALTGKSSNGGSSGRSPRTSQPPVRLKPPSAAEAALQARPVLDVLSLQSSRRRPPAAGDQRRGAGDMRAGSRAAAAAPGRWVLRFAVRASTCTSHMRVIYDVGSAPLAAREST